jgi:hypothetical protein
LRLLKARLALQVSETIFSESSRSIKNVGEEVSSRATKGYSIVLLHILIDFWLQKKKKYKAIQGISIKVSIKRNIFPRNMIKTQMKKTEKFMIYFLLNQF